MTDLDHHPPKVLEYLLERVTLPDENESLLGDFAEVYSYTAQDSGRVYALSWYLYHLVKLVPTFISNTIEWSALMIKNYLKITFRTLRKHKGFTLINVVGLALSMAICLMIIIFIKDQKNSDRFHENKDRIGQLYMTDANLGWDVDGWANTPGTLAPYLLSNYPAIEDAVRLRKMGGNILHEGTAIYISGLYAEPSFLNIFSFPLRSGDPETALSEPYSIVLSEASAVRFFGVDDPMGQTLQMEGLGEYTVTGVLKDLEEQSHFQFESLISFSTVLSLESSGVFTTDVNSWASFSRYFTYVLFDHESSLAGFRDQLSEIEGTLIPEDEREQWGFSLQPLLSINLGINLVNQMPGTKNIIDIFFIPFLALIIILLACFNYVILSIARSLKRTREIGLRKVIGSRRGQIIRLFFSETFVITLLALAGACLLMLWLIPTFNSIDIVENTGQQINLELMKDPVLYVYFLLFAAGVSILAGLYPALYLSSLKPISALQGVSKIKGLSHLLTRKILMGIQFGVSLVSIIFIVYFMQLYQYWMDVDRGINVTNMVDVYMRDVNGETFKNELVSNSNITGVSFSSQVPVYGNGDYHRLRTETMEEPVSVFYYSTDPSFLDLYHVDLLAGRNFSSAISNDVKKSILLNEKAVQTLALGSLEDAVGQTLFLDDDEEVLVIGVVQNFTNRLYLENPIDPVVLQYDPEAYNYANISYAGGRKEEVKTILTDVWKKLDPVHPVRYNFSDDARAVFESSISGPMRISTWACGFVVLIALFGLLGMATYTTEMRVKEIGIRKVLGASVPGVAFILSKDYLKLILYTALFAIPIAYFASDALFQFFAFRPPLYLWVLPAALLFILSLAIFTVGSQTIRAALSNPVETLRVD